jgi:dihydroneopterin aldolase
MNKILVEGIRLYCYHGCLQEEALIGSEYEVDVIMETDFSKAAESDELNQTIDYVVVYNIVKEQMAIRSKLLEHVAQRIIKRLKNEFPLLAKTEVKVTKINPPMNGNVARVSVMMSEM